MNQARLRVAVGLLTLLAGRLAGQSDAEGTPAATYDERYGQLHGMRPTNQVAPVVGLVLHRDVAELVLDSGSVVLLGPIGGRTVAAVFTGRGTFRFTPPAGIERERLRLFRKTDRMDEPFTSAVLLFSDSTLTELTSHVSFGPALPSPKAEDAVGKALDLWSATADFYKPDKDAHYVVPDLMATLLNNDRSGYFTATLLRDGTDPWQVTINPANREAVSLTMKTKFALASLGEETVTRFRRQGDTVSTGERAPAVSVKQYTMEVWLPETGTGDIRLSAAATLQLSADAPAGPWLPFTLFGKLDVDSARWEDGTLAPVFKGHLNPYLWVRASHRLAAGETPSLRLYYHGNVVDRWGSELFTMESVASSDWYPAPLDGRSTARFDITLHSPEAFTVSAVGDRADSAAYPGHMVTTRWRTPEPIRNATFNLGIFEPYRLEGDNLPLIELHWSDKITRLLSHNGVPGLKHAKEEIGADLQSAMKFYSSVYGEPPFKHFYAGEVPYGEGLAFPGMVDLSLLTGTTLLNNAEEGQDQVFRAHETAHQWWGISVDYSTYHDQWLSEGFSDFSGLWYLQTRTGKNDLYFGTLDRWRDEILRRRDKPVPISLGYRMDSDLDETANYNVIVYKKGAWVLHMLRMLTLNLQTMSEQRFKEIMGDFYASYRGKRASTIDFQRVVEQHVGQPMDWFFREWVDGWQIPTYSVATHTEPAENGQFRVKLRVLQENVPDDFLMYVPVTLDLGDNKVARVRVKVQGRRTEVELPLMPSRPKEVRFNDLHGVLAEVKNVGWD
jgi:hypothetical protein